MPPSVIVFDSHREALQRRDEFVRQVAGGVPVVATTSTTAALLHAAASPPGTVILIDLLATDRLALDRPGERLIRRLRRNPATGHVQPVAWSGHTGPDVIAGARRAGARAFVSARLSRDEERAALLAALGGEERWPDDAQAAEAAEAIWQAWFADRFGIPWAEWIEPTLARLATARERSALAPELVAMEAAASDTHAATRMRTLARVVAGEHRSSAAAVASAAALALVEIAAHRPLAERPSSVVSLERGASALRRAPSLIRAAGLAADETADVLAIDALITDARARRPAQRGAPAGDEVRHERHWAAGRRALALGGGVPVDDLIEGILVQLDAALVAVDDALQDELYHPEARAAAALQLVEPSAAASLPDVEVRGGVATWRGLSPLEVAVDHTHEVEDLRALVAAIDAAATLPA